jgi:hypothetical protein
VCCVDCPVFVELIVLSTGMSGTILMRMKALTGGGEKGPIAAHLEAGRAWGESDMPVVSRMVLEKDGGFHTGQAHRDSDPDACDSDASASRRPLGRNQAELSISELSKACQRGPLCLARSYRCVERLSSTFPTLLLFKCDPSQGPKREGCRTSGRTRTIVRVSTSIFSERKVQRNVGSIERGRTKSIDVQ